MASGKKHPKSSSYKNRTSYPVLWAFSALSAYLESISPIKGNVKEKGMEYTATAHADTNTSPKTTLITISEE